MGTNPPSADMPTCTVRHVGVVLHVHIHYTRDQWRGGFQYTYTVTVVCQVMCIYIYYPSRHTTGLTILAQAQGEAGHRSGTRAYTETSHAFAKRLKWREYGIKVCATQLPRARSFPCAQHPFALHVQVALHISADDCQFSLGALVPHIVFIAAVVLGLRIVFDSSVAMPTQPTLERAARSASRPPT